MLRAELAAHLDAAVEARIELGDSPDEAALEAVAEMGSPKKLASRLRRIHRAPNPTSFAMTVAGSMAFAGGVLSFAEGVWPEGLLAFVLFFVMLRCHRRREWQLEASLSLTALLTGLMGVSLMTSTGAAIVFTWVAASVWTVLASAARAEVVDWRRWAVHAPAVSAAALILFCPFWNGIFWSPSILRGARDLWESYGVGKAGSITRYDAAYGGRRAPVLTGTSVEWREGASWTKADQTVRPLLVRTAEEWRERIDSIDRASAGPQVERILPALGQSARIGAFGFVWLAAIHLLPVALVCRFRKWTPWSRRTMG
ncbi:hypothetical protein EON79_04955 [bacterium]|nr:MAG: hypothetical protein EON79_04955 [bacterium]